MANPLFDDALVDLLLHEVHDAAGLAALPGFEGQDLETFELFLGAARRLARELLFPSYRALDAEPPRFADGKITTHPLLPEAYAKLIELGCVAATRAPERGGAGLPELVFALGSAYLMAGNLAVYCYAGLTSGAAHLIETFGSEALDRDYTSEYLPEAFLRDQKLNSIHEGTTGIQSLDLLGRKVGAEGGAALRALGAAMMGAAAEARSLGVPSEQLQGFEEAVGAVAKATAAFAKSVPEGTAAPMLAHSVDYLSALSILCVGWQWLKMRAAVERAPATTEARSALRGGVRAASTYWLRTEIPKVTLLLKLFAEGEDSYLEVQPAEL